MALMALQPDDSLASRMSLADPTTPTLMAAPRPAPTLMAAPANHDEHMAATLTAPIMAATTPVPAIMSARGGGPTTMAAPSDGRMSLLSLIEAHLSKGLMAKYKQDDDPWGSPDNHPGFLGKFLHGLNVATGGTSRRMFEEEALEKRLQDVSKLDSEEGLQGEQGKGIESEIYAREHPTPKYAPLPTASG